MSDYKIISELNQKYIEDNLLSYDFGNDGIIEISLKSNNFSDVYYFENIDQLNEKINYRINNFNNLCELINFHFVRFIVKDNKENYNSL
jgi:hypothetical protein